MRAAPCRALFFALLGLGATNPDPAYAASKTFLKHASSTDKADHTSLGESSKLLVRLLKEVSSLSSEGKRQTQLFKKLLDSAGQKDFFVIGQNGAHELLVAARSHHSSANPSAKKVVSPLSELYLKVDGDKALLSALGALPGKAPERMNLDIDLDEHGAARAFAVTGPDDRATLSSAAVDLFATAGLVGNATNVRSVMRKILAGGPIMEAGLMKRRGRTWVVSEDGTIHHPVGFLVIRDSKKLDGLPFYVAHDFGPKVLVSKRTGHVITDENDDYLVAHGTLFAKRKGKLYAHDGLGKSMRAYEDNGRPAEERPFVYNETDVPGFVTTRDPRDRLGFIVGVDDAGNEYPIGNWGVSAHGFLPGTLRISPATHRLVGTLAEDGLDHAIDMRLYARNEERFSIAAQGFAPHTLHFDPTLGIVVGERAEGLAPLYSDGLAWPQLPRSKDGSPSGQLARLSVKRLYRDEIGTLVGEAEVRTHVNRYYVFPEKDLHVYPASKGYARVHVHPGSLFTVYTNDDVSQVHPTVHLMPKRGLRFEGIPSGFSLANDVVSDFVEEHGVFQGSMWRSQAEPAGSGKLYFHIDAYNGKVIPDLEEAGIEPLAP